ncbi:hypothetical protein GQ53DRAFT_757225 [Thozetella sp. PMI_491]|nr:hypothetical protein GQ53DRAFT_757225 [Thozetella sp. PMI_491]
MGRRGPRICRLYCLFLLAGTTLKVKRHVPVRRGAGGWGEKGKLVGLCKPIVEAFHVRSLRAVLMFDILTGGNLPRAAGVVMTACTDGLFQMNPLASLDKSFSILSQPSG